MGRFASAPAEDQPLPTSASSKCTVLPIAVTYAFWERSDITVRFSEKIGMMTNARVNINNITNHNDDRLKPKPSPAAAAAAVAPPTHCTRPHPPVEIKHQLLGTK
jgi:hypothetical protein